MQINNSFVLSVMTSHIFALVKVEMVFRMWRFDSEIRGKQESLGEHAAGQQGKQIKVVIFFLFKVFGTASHSLFLIDK
jgi:hypothetical protein